MKKLLSLALWLIKAAVFFTLFAFALNNQQSAKLFFFFGTFWEAPTALIVLSVFALGLIVGVLGMLPLWWRQRQLARGMRVSKASPQASSSLDTPIGI
ncbi:MAG: hypothetical protein RLZ63_921 [Pseudomonadota bacterium]